jgi:hypothetical protein
VKLTDGCDQPGRSHAYVVRKSDAFFDQGGGPAFLAEVRNKDCRPERYAAVVRRYDPSGDDIPDQDVAAIFMPFRYTSRESDSSPGKAILPITPRNEGGTQGNKEV